MADDTKTRVFSFFLDFWNTTSGEKLFIETGQPMVLSPIYLGRLKLARSKMS